MERHLPFIVKAFLKNAFQFLTAPIERQFIIITSSRFLIIQKPVFLKLDAAVKSPSGIYCSKWGKNPRVLGQAKVDKTYKKAPARNEIIFSNASALHLIYSSIYLHSKPGNFMVRRAVSG